MKMIIEMDVKEAQALTLQAMFEYWNRLGRVGSSRFVAFYVDGDGDFRPDCEMSFSESLPSLTPKMEIVAVVEDDNGNRKYDYDRIAWFLYEQRKSHGPPQWWRIVWHRFKLMFDRGDAK